MKLVGKILEGDVLAAARLIRGIEDEASEAVEELKSVCLHTGRACIVDELVPRKTNAQSAALKIINQAGDC